MRSGRWLPVAAMVLAAPAAAQDFDPASLDLAALVECRAEVKAYNGFAFWLAGDPGAAEKLGWRQVETDNLFLQQYETARPVAAFGHETRTIVFTSTGPMAVLDGIVASELAGRLGVVPVVATPEKFLGEKVVTEESETVDGTTYATRISLNVSTVDTHPGKVLVGCSYALEMK
jgi:hypothetical protein